MNPSSSPGRRDNGLPCTDWGALVDVDPRMSEALLSSLAAAGVPAFVEPAGGLDPFTRAVQLPARPLHRLWIDPTHAAVARAVVESEVKDLTRQLGDRESDVQAGIFIHPVPRTAARRVLSPPDLPAPPARRDGPREDPDAAWRALVEDFDRAHEGPVPPWPVTEDVDPPARGERARSPRRPAEDPGAEQAAETRRGSEAATTHTSSGDQDTVPEPDGSSESAPQRRHGDTPVGRGAAPGPRDSDEPIGSTAELPGWLEPLPVDDEGHFQPPPPPPVPRPTPRRLAAVLTVLVGVLLMFAPGVLGQQPTSDIGIVGLLLTIGGTAAFLYLMRGASARDDPDEGAVV